MKKKKYRKAHPQPAHYFWLGVDGCWFCKNDNNCGNCKVLKEQIALEKQKRKRKEKTELKKLYL